MAYYEIKYTTHRGVSIINTTAMNLKDYLSLIAESEMYSIKDIEVKKVGE